jgi:hypothetical protein
MDELASGTTASDVQVRAQLSMRVTNVRYSACEWWLGGESEALVSHRTRTGWYPWHGTVIVRRGLRLPHEDRGTVRRREPC